MPIWLRSYTFSEISQFYKEEKKASQPVSKEGTTSLVSPDGSVNKGAFQAASDPYKGKTSYK